MIPMQSLVYLWKIVKLRQSLKHGNHHNTNSLVLVMLFRHVSLIMKLPMSCRLPWQNTKHPFNLILRIPIEPVLLNEPFKHSRIILKQAYRQFIQIFQLVNGIVFSHEFSVRREWMKNYQLMLIYLVTTTSTKILKPGQRASWDPNGKLGWYVGLSMNHYRCLNCFIFIRSLWLSSLKKWTMAGPTCCGRRHKLISRRI